MRPSPIAQQEMAERSSGSWTLADYGDLLVVLVVIALGSALAGFEFAEWRHRERARIAAEAAKPVVLRPAPLTQWSCGKQEFREYREACMRRAQSGLIKPKEK